MQKKYQLSPKHCIAVDMFNNRIVDYSEIEEGIVPQILTAILDEINKLI